VAHTHPKLRPYIQHPFSHLITIPCCCFCRSLLLPPYVIGQVIQLKAEAGKTFSSAELKAAVAQHKPAILFLVQGESSTGTHQALGDGLGEACKAAGTLLVVDTVSND
jgi:hypothetical protein